MFKTLIFFSTIASFFLSLTLAPLGCFALWRRQIFFGDAMSHSALLGVSLSFLVGVTPWWGIFCICLVLSWFLSYGPRYLKLPQDSWLGLMTYTFVALGYIILKIVSQKTGQSTTFVEHFLFGDLLFLTKEDVQMMCGLSLLVITGLVYWWRPFLCVILDPQNAILQGLDPHRYQFILLFMLSMVITTIIPLVGALLVPGLLILPATIAYTFSRSPFGMVIKACIISLVMMILGLIMSFYADWPVGPSSVIVGFFIFCMKSFIFKKK